MREIRVGKAMDQGWVITREESKLTIINGDKGSIVLPNPYGSEKNKKGCIRSS